VVVQTFNFHGEIVASQNMILGVENVRVFENILQFFHELARNKMAKKGFVHHYCMDMVLSVLAQ